MSVFFYWGSFSSPFYKHNPAGILDILRNRPEQAEAIMNRIYSSKANKSLKSAVKSSKVNAKSVPIVVKPPTKCPRRVINKPVRRVLPTNAPPFPSTPTPENFSNIKANPSPITISAAPVKVFSFPNQTQSEPLLSLKKRSQTPSADAPLRLTLEALDCRRPTHVASSPLSQACKEKGTPHTILSSHQIVLLQHIKEQTRSAYKCEKRISTFDYLCGMFSHTKPLDSPSILAPMVVEESICAQAAKTHPSWYNSKLSSDCYVLLGTVIVLLLFSLAEISIYPVILWGLSPLKEHCLCLPEGTGPLFIL